MRTCEHVCPHEASSVAIHIHSIARPLFSLTPGKRYGSVVTIIIAVLTNTILYSVNPQNKQKTGIVIYTCRPSHGLSYECFVYRLIRLASDKMQTAITDFNIFLF